MYKTRKHFKVTSSETNGIYWRRVELTDLPKLKKMTNKESNELFGVFDIARVITDNPLSLCQVNPNGKITVFISLSDRPNVSCIASDNWTEWFNSFYDLKNVELNNTLFINVLLFRCVDSLIHLPVLLETVYVQIPETKNIIFVKPPGTKICTEISLPFSTLSAKSVSIDPEFGCPEILYHIREFSINKINLRIAEVDDFIDLRAYLGHRLDFLDNFYGEYSLAKILEFPGEDRINLVPNVKVNGLITVYTNLDYPFLDSVFDLYQYTGLIELKDEKNKTTEPKSILRLATDISRMMEKANISNIMSEIATNVQYEFISNQFKQLTDKTMKPMKQFFQSNILQKDSDTFSVKPESLLQLSTTTLNTSESEKKMPFFKEIHNTENKNIIKDFLKFQDKESKKANDMSYYVSSSYDSSENITFTKIDYKRTAFMIELMLIDVDEENKATWDYLISIFIYFIEFPQYEYCLMNLHTIATPPELKKFFCNATLKPNRTYPMGLLYILHRSFLTGKFSCVLVTKEHLELMELMIENHPLKHVISNNISKSVFEDTRYKTYIFQCNDQPIGYCVIRLNDEIKFLNSYFDVACYAYPKLARNHMAVLLNMDMQRTFIKKSRGLLKFVMEDSDINCLFYKLYTDITIMEECELSYINEIKELIPVKPRVRIQYDNENVSGDHQKFALFHINTRLCSTQTMSIDAKIVVVGASVVALSFLESLLFNPVSYYIRFGNIVLISDCGAPYQLALSDLEDRMIPKISHFNYEYMISMGFKSFVDVITGTVTAINKADKCVTVNEDEQVYYDYLFLFYGEQFGYTAEENETKPQNSIESSDKNNKLENLFLLNSEHDVTNAFKYIESIKNNEKDIVVLGKYLGSLTVINVLLESNIDGSRIVYVETHEKKNIPFIANQFIGNAVYNELHKQGVRVYKKCVFEKFTLNGDRTRIRKVTFTTAAGDALLTIDCAAVFWFDQKYISKVNWFTMLQSALKFDGHLVVRNWSSSGQRADETIGHY
ncbi:cilia- and flagella-associated protein 61-like isoform X2 [Aphis gossypii]|uniref:cilia- and flagella-associated protein 61-like isoform X2 n=1 Tax=Aphis gossypii TaxID=80765 RepID=UPI00215930F2|nr:cilia- and flagella-associated protein 61-like isoform X2 [Aphis gossypii]